MISRIEAKSEKYSKAQKIIQKHDTLIVEFLNGMSGQPISEVEKKIKLPSDKIIDILKNKKIMSVFNKLWENLNFNNAEELFASVKHMSNYFFEPLRKNEAWQTFFNKNKLKMTDLEIEKFYSKKTTEFCLILTDLCCDTLKKQRLTFKNEKNLVVSILSLSTLIEFVDFCKFELKKECTSYFIALSDNLRQKVYQELRPSNSVLPNFRDSPYYPLLNEAEEFCQTYLFEKEQKELSISQKRQQALLDNFRRASLSSAHQSEKNSRNSITIIESSPYQKKNHSAIEAKIKNQDELIHGLLNSLQSFESDSAVIKAPKQQIKTTSLSRGESGSTEQKSEKISLEKSQDKLSKPGLPLKISKFDASFFALELLKQDLTNKTEESIRNDDFSESSSLS